jgi:anti-sigma factor RsiW
VLSDDSRTEEEVACIDVADTLTAYLEGALGDDERRRIDRHLSGCPGCRAAIDQFRSVVSLVGRLTPGDVASLDPLTRDRLASTLRAPRRL